MFVFSIVHSKFESMVFEGFLLSDTYQIDMPDLGAIAFFGYVIS